MAAMKAEDYVQTVVGLHKTAFESSFNALVMAQELTEKAMQLACAQARWLPESGKVMIERWVGSMQEGRSIFQRAMNENYDNLSNALCRQTSGVRLQAVQVVKNMADQVIANSRQASAVGSQATELVQKMAAQLAENGRLASETARKMAQAVRRDKQKSSDEGNGRRKGAQRRSA
jgi:hypothetical protein